MWYADRWANNDSNYNTWAHSLQSECVWRRTTESSFTDTSTGRVNNLLCGGHEAAECTPQLVFITASATQSQLYKLTTDLSFYLIYLDTIKKFSSLGKKIGKNISSIWQYHWQSCGRGLAADMMAAQELR